MIEYPVHHTIVSTSALVPSVKCTVPPSMRAMFGFTEMRPWPMRGSSSDETVGCASPSRWSGFGRP